MDVDKNETYVHIWHCQNNRRLVKVVLKELTFTNNSKSKLKALVTCKKIYMNIRSQFFETHTQQFI